LELAPEPVAVVTKISAAAVSTSGAASQLFLFISPSLSTVERRILHRQRAFVRVERITDTQRNGSQVLAVAERQLVEHGHSERLEALLEDVLERLRGAPVGGRARQVAVVALVHLADDDARDPVELAGVAKLCQLAVDVVRRRVRVLEEEDRAVGLELPRRREGLEQEPETASHERGGDAPRGDRADVRV